MVQNAHAAVLVIDASTIALVGAIDLAHIRILRHQLDGIKSFNRVDVGGITKLDTAGALLLLQLARKQYELIHCTPEHEALVTLLAQAKPPLRLTPAHYAPGVLLIGRLGQGAVKAMEATKEILTFLGQTLVALALVTRYPKRLRIAEIAHHIEKIGINAIPIISLIAFLISVVLAYQSVEQLRPLGVQHLTTNLITISVLREMGVLLTAIMVAGRSGSAFTAEIGVMKVREEIDALKAIGIDPFELLVVPRLIAIIIVMPILTFIANIMGLLGGALLSVALIGTSMIQFIEKVHEVASNGNALLVGLIKAPVFGLFIGIVGCMQGMKVSGSAESVGTRTTASVVQSIFLVLMLDALFSIFFQQIKI
jgi:phospholipid/cholesterol/gamma-HCH transport system permease protein